MTMTSTCIDTELMPFDQAKSILANAAEALSSEYVPLSDALGRVAAESIVAKEAFHMLRTSLGINTCSSELPRCGSRFSP